MFDEGDTEESVQTTANVCSTQECQLQEIAEEPIQSTTNDCPSQECTLQLTTEEPAQSATQDSSPQGTSKEHVQSTKNHICSYEAIGNHPSINVTLLSM